MPGTHFATRTVLRLFLEMRAHPEPALADRADANLTQLLGDSASLCDGLSITPRRQPRAVNCESPDVLQ
jgi:hypothetical protein